MSPCTPGSDDARGGASAGAETIGAVVTARSIRKPFGSGFGTAGFGPDADDAIGAARSIRRPFDDGLCCCAADEGLYSTKAEGSSAVRSTRRLLRPGRAFISVSPLVLSSRASSGLASRPARESRRGGSLRASGRAPRESEARGSARQRGVRGGRDREGARAQRSRRRWECAAVRLGCRLRVNGWTVCCWGGPIGQARLAWRRERQVRRRFRRQHRWRKGRRSGQRGDAVRGMEICASRGWRRLALVTCLFTTRLLKRRRRPLRLPSRFGLSRSRLRLSRR